MAKTITIPRHLENERDVIVVSKKEYDELRRALDDAIALAKIAESEREYREGRYVEASSLEEALEKLRAGKFAKHS